MKLTRMCLAAGVGAVAMLASAGTSLAAPIISGAGAECATAFASACDTTGAIALSGVHTAWQPNNPDGSGAVWISYADTGVGGDTFAGSNPGNILSVFEYFSVAGTAWLSIKTWADDTAAMWLDGNPIQAANLTQGTCAVGAIGCEPDEFFLFEILLAAGDHVLQWDVWQIGTGSNQNINPFGLLYAGSFEEVPEVPEPGTLALLGIGLLGLGGAAMRRRRSA